MVELQVPIFMTMLWQSTGSLWLKLLWDASLLGALCSTCFLILVAIGSAIYLLRRHRESRNLRDFTPPVSLIKPLYGLEPDLEKNIESFFRLDYPDYEIIFGARNDEDLGLQLARSVAERYPDIPTKFVTSGEPPWPNARCYSVAAMNKVARHELLVISDSDVDVDPNYLREVIAPFADEKVGAVTCPYRGVPVVSPWALLEGLGMSVEMTSGVLVANLLEGMKFTLGPTMAVRKRCIEQIGGFKALGWFHADDFMLGNLVAAKGNTVVLSSHPIAHHVFNPALIKSLEHQLGWATSSRFSRPHGHIGTILTYGAPYGLLAWFTGWMLGNPGLGLAVFATTSILRMLQAILVGGLVVRDWRSVAFCWLYPFRDLMGSMFWVASFVQRDVRWRDDIFRFRAGENGYADLVSERDKEESEEFTTAADPVAK